MTVQPNLPVGQEKIVPGSKPVNTVFLYVVSLLSAVGGFLFGYDTGIASGAMVFIRPQFNLNELWVEIVVSITILWAWIFSGLAGWMSNKFGRKPTILLASVVFTVGSIILGFAQSRSMLVVGRAVVGGGVGLASMTVPMYIAEVAPAHVRGSLVTLNNCFINGGQFIAAIVAGIFSTDEYNGWRWMLGLAAVPAVIQFVGFLFMPESPRWLIQKGHHDKAMKVLKSIRSSTDNIEEEFRSVKDDCAVAVENKRLAIQRSDSRVAGKVFVRVFQSPGVRRALLLGCVLQMIQQLAGINTVMYYAATIIEMSGVKDKSTAVWLAAATAAVNFVCTFVAFFLVDRLGRRILTLSSLAGVIVSLGLLGIGFHMAHVNSIPLAGNGSEYQGHCAQYSMCSGCTNDPSCGFCYTEINGTFLGTCLPVNPDDHSQALGDICVGNYTANLSLPLDASESNELTWIYEYCPLTEQTAPYSWAILAGLMAYLFFFAPGMGPMPWTINSEIYPLWARSFCYSITTSVNWAFNLLVSMTFLSLTSAITKHGAFYVYAGISAFGWVFFYYMLPETGHRDLTEVEELFELPCRERRKRQAPHQKSTSTITVNTDCKSTINGNASFTSLDEKYVQRL